MQRPTTENPPTIGTTRVTYRFTVLDQERVFTSEATVSGDPAEAATKLTNSTLADARSWLLARPARLQNETVMVRGLFFRHPTKIKVRAVEPNTEPQRGTVTATVQVNGVSHEYSSEYSTDGDPYNACAAALNAAQVDLWSWAYAQQLR